MMFSLDCLDTVHTNCHDLECQCHCGHIIRTSAKVESLVTTPEDNLSQEIDEYIKSLSITGNN